MGSVRGGQVGGPSGWSSRSRPVASVAAPSRGHLPGRPVFENTFRFQRCSADWSLCKELGQACEMLGADQKRSLLERNAKRTSMWPRSSVRQEPWARAQGGGPAARRRWRWTPPGPAGRPRRGSSRWAAASAPSPGPLSRPLPKAVREKSGNREGQIHVQCPLSKGCVESHGTGKPVSACAHGVGERQPPGSSRGVTAAAVAESEAGAVSSL